MKKRWGLSRIISENFVVGWVDLVTRSNLLSFTYYVASFATLDLTFCWQHNKYNIYLVCGERSLFRRNILKEFFKDVTNFVRDMDNIFKFLIVGLLMIGLLFIFRATIKMFYNKDKIKWTFMPIIGMAIIVAVIVFLCIA